MSRIPRKIPYGMLFLLFVGQSSAVYALNLKNRGMGSELSDLVLVAGTVLAAIGFFGFVYRFFKPLIESDRAARSVSNPIEKYPERRLVEFQYESEIDSIVYSWARQEGYLENEVSSRSGSRAFQKAGLLTRPRYVVILQEGDRVAIKGWICSPGSAFTQSFNEGPSVAIPLRQGKKEVNRLLEMFGQKEKI